MGKFYTLLIRIVLLLITPFAFNQSRAISMEQREKGDTAKSKVAKITDTRPNKPAILNRNFKAEFIPFKLFDLMGSPQSPKSLQLDTFALLNVKVYPVPVSDQINVSYHLNKDANVTIQLFDFLGKKLITLLSRRMPAGVQNNNFPLTSRLNTGIYFIRVIVGSQQPVTKRISVL